MLERQAGTGKTFLPVLLFLETRSGDHTVLYVTLQGDKFSGSDLPLMTFISQAALSSVLSTKTRAGVLQPSVHLGTMSVQHHPWGTDWYLIPPQSNKGAAHKLIKKTVNIWAHIYIKIGSEKPGPRIYVTYQNKRMRTPNSAMALACYLTTQLCSKGPIS